MPARTDDDDIIVFFRLRVAPLLTPALVATQGFAGKIIALKFFIKRFPRLTTLMRLLVSLSRTNSINAMQLLAYDTGRHCKT